MQNKRLLQAARDSLQTCLNLDHRDTLLILCTKSTRPIADIFAEAGRRLAAEVVTLASSELAQFRGSCYAILKDAFRNATAVVSIHPDVLPVGIPQQLLKIPDTRILCIPASQAQVYLRWTEQKVNRVGDRTLKLSDILSIGKKISLETPSGTALSMSIRKRRGVPDIGMVCSHTNICSMPSGEARIQPEPGSVEGRAMIDAIAGEPARGAPAQLIIKNGRILQIRGTGSLPATLRRLVQKSGQPGRRLLEFSVGINEHVPLGKSYNEDKKSLGNAALTFGAPSREHLVAYPPVAGILRDLTLVVDGRKIVQQGELRFP